MTDCVPYTSKVAHLRGAGVALIVLFVPSEVVVIDGITDVGNTGNTALGEYVSMEDVGWLVIGSVLISWVEDMDGREVEETKGFRVEDCVDDAIKLGLGE